MALRIQCLLLAILFTWPHFFSVAEDQASIEKISLAIQKKELDLKDARQKEEKAIKDHGELVLKQKEFQTKLSGIEQKKKDVLKEQDKLQKELSLKESKYQEMLTRSRLRLKAIYTKSGGIAFPSSTISSKDLSLFLPYALHIAKHDKELLLSIQKQVADINETKSKITTKFDAIKKLDEESRENLKLAKEETEKADAAKRALAKERIGIDKALSALKIEANKVSAVIEQITKEEPKPVIQPSIWKKEDTEELIPKPVDIFSPSVKLTSPVQGEIIRGYGSNRLEKFDDMLLSKGVEFSTEPKSEVKSIAEGSVAYVGQLPGYGLVVIIDHGSHAHTLYARLSESKVTVQHAVRRGEVIGLAGLPDNEKKNFYFEVRQNGKPVDPTNLLNR